MIDDQIAQVLIIQGHEDELGGKIKSVAELRRGRKFEVILR